jgi:hypothetical protein
VKYPTKPRWIVETVKDQDGWLALVVIVLFEGDRWNFHVSHNRQRFSRAADFIRLCEAFPDVSEQFTEWLEAA